MTNKTESAFVLYCRTGCSCCSGENHHRGPYKTREDAEQRIAYFYSKDSKFWPVASQYAVRGGYDISEVTIEYLPDGRVIIDGNRVIPSIKFVTVDSVGFVDDNDTECFDVLDC